jgi:type II secretory pathway component GspD/PulD (secretin)
MDFDGVDIKVFIKFIADITGKNFIIDDKVSGKITVISPRKMTMDEPTGSSERAGGQRLRFCGHGESPRS